MFVFSRRVTNSFRKDRLIAFTRSKVLIMEKKENVETIEINDLVKPHYNGKVYGNPFDTWEERGFTDILKWKPWKRGKPMSEKELETKIPIVEPNLEIFKNPDVNEFSLVQMEGVSFLTDPVWCERASPVQFVGPKRYRKPPCSIEQLPKIDFVVISHNHYDHLDRSTVLRLGNSAKWYVPKGLKSWFTEQGVSNVVELNWWEESKYNDKITVTCTPCQHWSKRYAWERCTSLWSSWVVVGQKKRVFFSGDTGYCNVFPTIGKQFGPFDLGLIAIGAYCPRWFMKPQHVDPYEAVQMHQDLNCKFSVGVHWGTFILTDEPEDEPPILLNKALDEKKISQSEFITTKIGETIKVPNGSGSK